MSPSTAFGYYFGMHLHFSSEKYSIIKYGIKTNATIDRYNKLTQPRRYKFEWLANKFPKTEDLVYACIGCELDNVNIQYSDKQSILDSYINYKTRREALTYRLKTELQKYYSSDQILDYNGLIFGYYSKTYSPELTLLLDSTYYNKLNATQNDPTFLFAHREILKLRKYLSFFNPAKYGHLLNLYEKSVSA